jgi:hypothetical protein
VRQLRLYHSFMDNNQAKPLLKCQQRLLTQPSPLEVS